MSIFTRSVVLAAFLVISLPLSGYYFVDEFNFVNKTNWYSNFYMAREGRVDLSVATPGYTLGATGEFFVSNNIYGANDYDSAWGGVGIVLSNRKFNASSSIPVGAMLDVRGWTISANGASPVVEAADFGLWVVEDALTDLSLYNANYMAFLTRVMYFYSAKNGDTPDNFFGSFVNGADIKLNLSNAIRPDGSATNLANFHSLTVNVTVGTIVNTNVALMATHDGSSVSFYFNPDPDNNDAHPNEYCFVGNFPVSFTNNIRFMINEEVRNKNSSCDARFGSFMIRSAADSSAMSVSIDSEDQSSNSTDLRRLQFNFANGIYASNAGINVITISKPDAWSNYGWDTSKVYVISDYMEDGTLIETNTNVSYADFTNTRNRYINRGECVLRTNGNELWIRLGAMINATNTTQHNTRISW